MKKRDESQKSKVMLKIRRESDLPAMAETVNVINKFKSSEDTLVTELANILLKDYADIRKFVPAWYRNGATAAGYILILPVTVNNKNIGLITIERDTKGFAGIGRSHLNYLRILRDKTVMATKQSLRAEDTSQPRA